MDINNLIQTLQQKWLNPKKPIFFLEPILYNSEKQKIFSSGFQHEDQNGFIYFGSSAHEDVETAITKSWYEFYERYILVSKKNNPEKFYNLVNKKKEYTGTIENTLCFLDSKNSHWRFAISNGVAAGKNFRNASINAENELIERDAILRSWYGQYSPTLLKTTAFHSPASGYKLLSYYEVPSASVKHKVIIACAQKSEENPLICGFGCATDLNTAKQKALSECIQRLCFLNEYLDGFSEIPKEMPVNSPEYHQEFYLTKEGNKRLKQWLDCPRKKVPNLKKNNETRFIILNEDPFVVKAINNNYLPLIFGNGYAESSFHEIDIDPSNQAYLELHPIF